MDAHVRNVKCDGQLLSVRDAAVRLNVSVRLVWKLIARGDLPQPLRIGATRRFRPEDITIYIDRLTQARKGH